MSISRLDRIFGLDLNVFVTGSDGSPATGKTVQAAIQRRSDDKYWDWGSSLWVVSIQWSNATEVGNGLYKKEWTTPDADDQYVIYWKETTIPAYTASDFVVDDKLSTIYTRVDQPISTTESNIRGSDSDDLRIISEQIDGVDTNVDTLADLYNYDAFIQDKFHIPLFSTSLTSALALGAVTANVTSTTDLPNQGYVKIDSEYIHYSGKTSNTLTGLTRGKFGTADALHVVDSTVYQLRIYEAWLRATGADGELLTLAKAPKFGITDIETNTIMASADMTKLVEGLYYSRIFLIPTDIARDWRALFTLYHTGETSDSDIVKDVEVVNEPLTQVVYNTTSGGPIRFHESGYYKADGITYVAWTDVMKGPIIDGSGSPVGNVIVRAFLTSAGVPLISDRHPPYDNTATGGTNDAGKYDGALRPEAGGTTYRFTFEKEGYQFASVNRTLTP